MSGLIQDKSSLSVWQRVVTMTNTQLEDRINDVVLVVLIEMAARGLVAPMIAVGDLVRGPSLCHWVAGQACLNALKFEECAHQYWISGRSH